MEECKESLKVVRYPKNDVFNRKLDLHCGDFDGDIDDDTISHKLDQLIKETTDKLAEQMLKFGKYSVYCSDRTLSTIDIVKTNDGYISHYNFN